MSCTNVTFKINGCIAKNIFDYARIVYLQLFKLAKKTASTLTRYDYRVHSLCILYPLIPTMNHNPNRAIALNRNQKRFKLIDFLVGLGIFWTACSNVALAQSQIVPDDTLGNESSQVVPNNEINGIPTEAIEGGAQRGSNLFHSFSQFNIETGRGAYFANPAGINNIFGRVTDNNVSEIFGTLGVLGNADLFLINPNGIIFGENASLDLNGSFLATTASGIGFGEQGFFNADEPNTPPLLTVQPSVFVFNQTNPGTIENRSIAPAGVDILGDSLTGLRVPNSESLMLLGGEVIIDGGGLNVQDGRIEIIALQGNQTIGLNSDSANLSFDLPTELQTNNILFSDRALVTTSGRGGGNIVLRGKDITLSDSTFIFADTLGDLNGRGIFVRAQNLAIDSESRITADVVGSGNGGRVAIDVTTLNLNNGGTISTRTVGLGNAGIIDITAAEIEIVGSDEASGDSEITANASSESRGNAGNIVIDTATLKLSQGGKVENDTFSSGDGGAIDITAAEIEIIDSTEDSTSEISVDARGDAGGNGGELTIDTNSLKLRNGGRIEIDTSGSGDGGNSTIDTDSLIIRDRGIITNFNSGSGNSGATTINAERIEIVGEGAETENTLTGINVGTEFESTGNGGNLTINTDILKLSDIGLISSATFGEGNSGNINITASTIDIVGAAVFDRDIPVGTAILSTTQPGSTGDGGSIVIKTDRLSIDGANGSAQISNGTLGSGDGGEIDITANKIEIIGNFETGNVPTGISNSTLELNGVESTGNGGDINIKTTGLQIIDGGSISSTTFSGGNAGNIAIDAEQIEIKGIRESTDNITGLSRSLVVTSVQPEATGNGGTITIDADNLKLSEGGIVSTSTLGSGNAGNLNIAAEEIELIGDGISDAASRLSASVLFDGTGAGGNLSIDTGSLEIANEASISVGSSNSLAGNLNITADSLSLDGGELIAETGVSGMGNGANINLEIAESLFLNNEGQIRANALGDADGGNIDIDTEFIVAFPAINSRGSDIIADAVGGRGGAIDITARGVFGIESRANLTPFNDISASSEFGLSGEVVFNLTQFDPIANTLDVTEQPTEAKVSRVCSTRKSDGDRDRSEFTITGRGGVSKSPSNTLESQGGWEDWRTDKKGDRQPTSANSEHFVSYISNTDSNPIVEAQQWIVNQKGVVELVAEQEPFFMKDNYVCRQPNQ